MIPELLLDALRSHVIKTIAIEEFPAIIAVAHGRGFARFSQRGAIGATWKQWAQQPQPSRELACSIGTVEDDMRRICRSANITSRTGLALW